MSLNQFANKVDIPYTRIYDYTKRLKSKPSIGNVFKITQAFPQYTCFIFNINPKQLPEQIILKE
ncbi:hypothetical protein CRYPA_935 [uncultured Candidatus Thioglobus sp.]|nr:hypothetical protein CRYPA_935 [uncultured Candidatus Thioglobus sp.]